MTLNYIFGNIKLIMLVVWLLFFVVMAIRFLRPLWVKNISYWWIVGIVVALHLFYGAFITWGQYHVWATGNVVTKVFVTAPLPPEAPLPSVLEWLRPNLEQPLGYFAYYVFGRVWQNIIILFILSGFFYSILKLWSNYRGGFLPNGPEIILALLLISGYPGVLVLIPLGFIMAIIWFIINIIKNRSASGVPLYIEPSFLIITPVVLFFGDAILSYL